MGINCFASPTNSNTNVAPVGFYGTSGQIYACVRNYTNYNTSVNFAVGIQGTGTAYSFGNISASFREMSSSSSFNDYISYYTTDFICDGVTLYAPYLQVSEGNPTYSFNRDGYIDISYEYYDDEAQSWNTFSKRIAVDLDNYRSFFEFSDWQPVINQQFVLNYRLSFTPYSADVLSFSVRDYYSDYPIEVLRSYFDNSQYQTGFSNGYSEGKDTGEAVGKQLGRQEGYVEGYNQGVKDGGLDFNGIGGFIDIMLRGQRYYVLNNDGSLKLDSYGDPIVAYDGGIMSTPLFGESFPWITVGNILGSFVAISLALFIMKLFLGG